LDYSVLLYPAFATIGLAAADFFLKMASGRINSLLIAVIYSAAMLISSGAMVAVAALRGDQLTLSSSGMLYSVLVGIAFTVAVTCLSLTFASGISLSVATPAVRMSSVVIASLLGIVMLSEPVSMRYVAGTGIALAGIALIAIR
jgi:uncharacterized membrane protein